jgi:LacI family transcriptional regulator
VYRLSSQWDQPLPIERGERFDGVLSTICHPGHLRELRAYDGPVVMSSSARPARGIPTVRADDFQAGQIACEHLRGTGVTSLGGMMTSRQWFAHLRMGGFVRTARRMGIEPSVLLSDNNLGERYTRRDLGRVKRWLRRLEKPAGLFCTEDRLTIPVYRACEESGLVIGRDVAIVGVNNKAIFCETCDPPLSSVDLGTHRIGYRAARKLADLMAGGLPPRRPITVPPVGLVARASSDVLAVDDAEVAAAIRLIRSRADCPLQVSDVVAEVGGNRRRLERRFRRVLGRTPYEEILRTRVERARQLLAATQMPVAQVASECGFDYAHNFSTVFRRLTGMTPSDYRGQYA